MHTNLHNSMMNSKDKISEKEPDIKRSRTQPNYQRDLIQNQTNAFRDGSAQSLKFPRYNDDRRLEPLHVSIKHGHGGNSPLPPALSPASLSQASHSSAFNTSSRPSPAPPVIMEEDGSLSSAPSNPPSSNNQPSSLLFMRTGLPVLPSKPFEKRNCTPTESATSTSETCSTSTSTSSSSASSVVDEPKAVPLPPPPQPPSASQANGIPILEKMSVSLSRVASPPPLSRSPIQITSNSQVQSPVKKQPIQVDAVEYPAQPVLPSTSPKLIPGDPNDITTASPVKKPARKPPARKKRAPKKRWSRDSDSDFEGGRGSAIVKKAKESAKK